MTVPIIDPAAARIDVDARLDDDLRAALLDGSIAAAFERLRRALVELVAPYLEALDRLLRWMREMAARQPRRMTPAAEGSSCC
jgi:hypothetical protein